MLGILAAVLTLTRRRCAADHIHCVRDGITSVRDLLGAPMLRRATTRLRLRSIFS